jgi:hypothetical protein
VRTAGLPEEDPIEDWLLQNAPRLAWNYDPHEPTTRCKSYDNTQEGCTQDAPGDTPNSSRLTSAEIRTRSYCPCAKRAV